MSEHFCIKNGENKINFFISTKIGNFLFIQIIKLKLF